MNVKREKKDIERDLRILGVQHIGNPIQQKEVLSQMKNGKPEVIDGARKTTDGINLRTIIFNFKTRLI